MFRTARFVSRCWCSRSPCVQARARNRREPTGRSTAATRNVAAHKRLRHAFPDLGSLRRLPQRHHHADRRGHLDRRQLADQHDGQRRPRSVLDGRRAARDDRPSHRRQGSSRTMHDLPHADDAVRSEAGGRRRGSRSRTFRPTRASSATGWPTTASPARCVTRSRIRISASAKASSAASRSMRRRRAGRAPHLRSVRDRAGPHDDHEVVVDVPADARASTFAPRSCAPRATRCSRRRWTHRAR